MRTHVILAENYPTRISRHRINAKWLGDRLGKQAEEADDWLFEVEFGFDPLQAPPTGNLPDCVECCLLVANPLGLTVAFLSRCSGRVSSKVTAANTCSPGTGGLWGTRRGKGRIKAAEKLRALHAEYWTGMETLGAMAAD